MPHDWKSEGKKYAIIAGRFQPFHEGHADLVEYALEQGLTPIIMICGVTGGKRNPLSIEQRKSFIQCRFPQIPDAHIGVWHPTARRKEETRPDVDKFIEAARRIVPLDESVMLHLEKGVDKSDYLIDGIIHPHIQYGLLLNRPFTSLDGEALGSHNFSRVYHATDIRADFARHKGKMHPPNAVSYEQTLKVKSNVER